VVAPAVAGVAEDEVEDVEVLAPEDVALGVVAVHDGGSGEGKERHVVSPSLHSGRHPAPTHRAQRRRLNRAGRTVHPELLPPARLLDEHREARCRHAARDGPPPHVAEDPLRRRRPQPCGGAVRR